MLFVFYSPQLERPEWITIRATRAFGGNKTTPRSTGACPIKPFLFTGGCKHMAKYDFLWRSSFLIINRVGLLHWSPGW